MPAAPSACRCCRWAPRSRSTRSCRCAPLPKRTDWLIARPFAHRGLHGAGISENGMAAFDAAIAAGFGIECDVRVSRDGVPFVFHDAGLKRMTGQDGAVADRDAARIDALRMPDGGAVPRLAALLDACTNTPLLVEIKADGRDVASTCAAVAAAIDDRAQPVAIMSFNPLALRWFARHRPQILRGLVSSSQNKPHLRAMVARTLALWLANPDFLACDIRDLPLRFAAAARRRGLAVLTWTVRTAAQRACAAAHADQIIFETGDD